MSGRAKIIRQVRRGEEKARELEEEEEEEEGGRTSGESRDRRALGTPCP